jgi:hypothetical protein
MRIGVALVIVIGASARWKCETQSLMGEPHAM